MFKKVFSNTVYLTASQVFSRLLGFVYFIFLARVLGIAEFGIYSFVIAFIYNFIPVADFGIERLVLRDIAREPEKTNYYFQRLLPLRIFLAGAAYLTAILLGVILGLSGQKIFYLSIFGLSLFPYSLAFLIISFQNAKEKMQYLALANIVIIITTVIMGLSFIYLRLSIFWIFLAYPIANTVVALYMFILARKLNFSFKIKVDFGFCKQILSQSWIFAAFTIIAVFYLRTTVLFIGVFKDSVSAGLYNSVFKFIEAGILIPQSLALALFPLSSRLFIEDKKKLMRVYLKGLGVLLLLALPFFLALVLFHDIIISLAYGERYLPAVKVFRILGLSFVLFSVNTLSGNIIQNSEKVKNFLPFALASLIFAVFLSWILVPKYSLIGAGWAVVGGELFGFLVSNFFVYKFLKDK